MFAWSKRALVLLLGVVTVSVAGLALARGAVGLNSPPAKTLSLAEAYNLAKPRALTWDSRARLYEMHSADSKDVIDSNQGLDGRRASWYVDFVIPDTTRHFFVFVSNGEVAAEREAQNPTLWTPFEELPAIAVADIMATARANGVQRGTSKGFGYHFRLHKHDNKPTFAVLGQDKSGLRTEIRFDPLTGTAHPVE
jgi:hypothetical protein